MPCSVICTLREQTLEPEKQNKWLGNQLEPRCRTRTPHDTISIDFELFNVFQGTELEHFVLLRWLDAKDKTCRKFSTVLLCPRRTK